MTAFTLASPVFAHGGPLPRQHTADGPDLSPPLTWVAPPDGTGAFALAVEDPDAPNGTWVHWILWNLPPSARGLPQDVRRVRHLHDGSRQGENSWGHLGWAGPAPPPGETHRYVFRLLALDARLDLPGGAGRDGLDAAVAGHVLAEAALMATYGRGASWEPTPVELPSPHGV